MKVTIQIISAQAGTQQEKDGVSQVTFHYFDYQQDQNKYPTLPTTFTIGKEVDVHVLPCGTKRTTENLKVNEDNIFYDINRYVPSPKIKVMQIHDTNVQPTDEQVTATDTKKINELTLEIVARGFIKASHGGEYHVAASYCHDDNGVLRHQRTNSDIATQIHAYDYLDEKGKEDYVKQADQNFGPFANLERAFSTNASYTTRGNTILLKIDQNTPMKIMSSRLQKVQEKFNREYLKYVSCEDIRKGPQIRNWV